MPRGPVALVLRGLFKLRHRLACLLGRRRVIILHGGLGDIISMAPLLKRAKRATPHLKLVVLYRDDDSPNNPAGLSYDTARRMTDAHGDKVNYRQEYLENFSFIHELRGADLNKALGEYWYPPEAAKRYGGQATPSQYQEILTELFTPEDETIAARFWERHMLGKKFVVAIHFRRSAAQLHQIYQRIIQNKIMGDDVRVLAMGSTEHERVPPLREAKTVSAVDSYRKGLGLRPLLAIGRKAHLFLGGRGGFEIFFWYAQVPTINLFDDVGFQEIQKGFWTPPLWKENPIPNGLLNASAVNPDEALETIILPRFLDWKRERSG